MTLGIWQIIMIVLLVLGLGISLAKHGEPKTDKYNFWVTLVSAAIQFVILYFGGFFN